jgi:hypothetical protein
MEYHLGASGCGLGRSTATPRGPCGDGARGGGSHQGFELGEGLLDRVQVGRVGRQVEEARPLGLDRFADALDLVGGRLSMMMTSPQLSVGASACSTYAWKRSPLIASSKTQGAVIRL